MSLTGALAIMAATPHAMPVVATRVGCETPKCGRSAYLVEPDAAQRPGPGCVTNPLVQAYDIAGQGRVNAVAMPVTLRAEKDMVQTSLLLRVPDGAGDFAAGAVCAPDEVLADGRTLKVDPYAPDESRVSAGVVGGGLFGSLLGAHRRQSLLAVIFGYSTDDLVQIMIRSQPAGAALLFKDRILKFRTNASLSVPRDWLAELRVAIGARPMALGACAATEDAARRLVVFDCAAPKTTAPKQ